MAIELMSASGVKTEGLNAQNANVTFDLRNGSSVSTVYPKIEGREIEDRGGQMKKVTTESSLLQWSKPEVRRIDAGSAEAAKNKGVPDAGGPGINDFS